MRGKPHKRPSLVQPLNTNYRFIPLTQNQIAIVDAVDFARLSKQYWYAAWSPDTKSFYARTRTTFMHVAIMRHTADHISHDTLDNRRQNLRPANHAQNMLNKRKYSNNKSGFIGVWARRGKWRAAIQVNGKTRNIGDFASAEEAAHARDKYAKELHGEFAFLNFPS